MASSRLCVACRSGGSWRASEFANITLKRRKCSCPITLTIRTEFIDLRRPISCAPSINENKGASTAKMC